MSEEEMNKIIKGKTHYYENDTLTAGTFKIGETGTFPNGVTTTYSPSRVYDTEEIENIINENEKLKQDKQELTRIVEAYKDKEDKIREYIENHLLFTENYDFDFEEVNKDILQILNEGGKE